MSFTAREARYLARRPEPVRIPSVLFLALVVGILGTALAYQPAHAEPKVEAEVIYQNDHYCELIRDGHSKVIGASGEAVRELCAREGVTL